MDTDIQIQTHRYRYRHIDIDIDIQIIWLQKMFQPEHLIFLKAPYGKDFSLFHKAGPLFLLILFNKHSNMQTTARQETYCRIIFISDMQPFSMTNLKMKKFLNS